MSEAWQGGSDTRWRRFRAALFATWNLQGRITCEVGMPGCTVQREQIDHVHPLSRGGARYDPANCRPACAWCNSKRGSRAAIPQPQPRRVTQW